MSTTHAIQRNYHTHAYTHSWLGGLAKKRSLALMMSIVGGTRACMCARVLAHTHTHTHTHTHAHTHLVGRPRQGAEVGLDDIHCDGVDGHARQAHQCEDLG